MRAAIVIVVLITFLSAAFAGPYEDGVEANKAGAYQKAVEIWIPWAEQGHSKAQFALGVMYEKGRGVSQDISESMKWFARAAEQGYAGAQFRLGHAYFTGEGVSQDNTKAAKWFRRAADQGDKFSQLLLSGVYAGGIGEKEDLVQALKWLIVSEQLSDKVRTLANRMSAADVAEARRLASEWKPKLEPQSW